MPNLQSRSAPTFVFVSHVGHQHREVSLSVLSSAVPVVSLCLSGPFPTEQRRVVGRVRVLKNPRKERCDFITKIWDTSVAAGHSFYTRRADTRNRYRSRPPKRRSSIHVGGRIETDCRRTMDRSEPSHLHLKLETDREPRRTQ